MSIDARKIFETPRFDVMHRSAGDRDYFYVAKPDSALAVVRDQSGAVALLKTSRVNVKGDAWELPGGRVEPGESPITAIIREVREELKFSFSEDQVVALGQVLPLPSVTDEVAHIFEISSSLDLSHLAGPVLETHEGIKEIALFSPTEILKMLRKGTISCSVDGYALFLSLVKEIQ